MTGGGRGFCALPLGYRPPYATPAAPWTGFAPYGAAPMPWNPFMAAPGPWSMGAPWMPGPWGGGRPMGFGFGMGFGRGMGMGRGRGWGW